MGRLRKDATPPDTPPKKERLTLTQLAGYDDILTDALVDHVRPNRSSHLHIHFVLTNRSGVFLDHNTKESGKIQSDPGN